MGRQKRQENPGKQVRLTRPMVRMNGELRPASWDEALDRAAAGLSTARDQWRNNLVRYVLLLQGQSTR